MFRTIAPPGKRKKKKEKGSSLPNLGGGGASGKEKEEKREKEASFPLCGEGKGRGAPLVMQGKKTFKKERKDGMSAPLPQPRKKERKKNHPVFVNERKERVGRGGGKEKKTHTPCLKSPINRRGGKPVCQEKNKSGVKGK